MSKRDPADRHDVIRVQGARENNLKDVSVELPKRRLTVFTGVSGSGKSSLVFGTIAAESQRLINETYSTFVQGFMPTLARPDVEVLEGLTTAILVDQERMGASSRSTVGTATDANAMLRVLFSRLGKPHLGSPKAFAFNVPSVRGVGAVSVAKGSGKTEKKTFTITGGMCPRCEGMGSVKRVGKTSAMRLRPLAATLRRTTAKPPGQQGRRGRMGCDLRQFGARACRVSSLGLRTARRPTRPLRGVDVASPATQSSARPVRRSSWRRPRGRRDRFADCTQVARDARRLGHHRHETKSTPAVGARENIQRKRALQELRPRPIASSSPRRRRLVDTRPARAGSRRLRHRHDPRTQLARRSQNTDVPHRVSPRRRHRRAQARQERQRVQIHCDRAIRERLLQRDAH